MSSSESTPQKRCIVQRLDFENGIVTNIRTKSRVRKKLRARIVREIEEADDSGEERQPCGNSLKGSPVLTQNKRQVKPPVPVKKQSRSDGSPVFRKRTRLSQREDDCESLAETSAAVESPPSPVFKPKPNVQSLLSKSQELQKAFGRTTCPDSLSPGNSSSCGGSSYQIDDFTQESKRSIKISSVDSAEVKNKSSGDYSVDNKSDSSKIFNISWNKDESDPFAKWLEAKEMNDSSKNIRKNYKKNSLSSRLQKLLQKQASEKLLWEHQNRRNSTSSLKLVTVDFWSDELKFVLKCRPLAPESDIVFLIVDRKWVPGVKNIQEGSILHLHPPWQKLSVEKPILTVFLNVICLDVGNEMEETSVKNPELQLLPVEEFECDPTPFINSLFSSRFSELLI